MSEAPITQSAWPGAGPTEVTARVVPVRRKAGIGWLERRYLPMIVRGLVTTGAHFFRNLIGFATGRRRAFVVQYPEERVQYPDAFRGMPVLVEDAHGRPRCVACGLCEFACPSHCIDIVAGERDDDPVQRAPTAFDIDMSRCMFCGLCEEACPEEAIVMSEAVEIASFGRSDMRFDMERLLVPEATLARRLSFLRADYDRADASPRATGGPR